MDAKQLKVYSTMLRNWRGGKQSDVFDLMYESSLDYAAVKVVLDTLIGNGDASRVDIKTYQLIGDAEKRSAEIFTCGTFGGVQEMRGLLINALRHVVGVKADDEEFARTNDAIQKIIEEAARRVNGEAEAQLNEMHDRSLEALICDEDYDEDDEDDEDGDDDEDYDEDDEDGDDDDDRNNGELCVEKARPFYEELSEDADKDLDGVMENVFGAVEICNHCYIAPEHFILAMLCTECAACDVLKSADVDGDKYYERFLASVPKGVGILGFTPRARFLLRRAVGLAKDIGGAEAKAGSQHLLLALLTETHTIALRILKDTGADIDLISSELDKVLKRVG